MLVKGAAGGKPSIFAVLARSRLVIVVDPHNKWPTSVYFFLRVHESINEVCTEPQIKVARLTVTGSSSVAVNGCWGPRDALQGPELLNNESAYHQISESRWEICS